MLEVVFRNLFVELDASSVVRYRVASQNDDAALFGDRLKPVRPAIDHLFERIRMLVPPKLIEEKAPEVE